MICTVKTKLATLGWSLLAIFLAVVMLLACSALFIPKDNLQAFGMENEAANGVMGERANSLDVLFIGDSEAFSSFSPMQMWHEHGFTSYVCATSSQQLPYGNTLLKRATKNQSPKIVVFETNSIYAPFRCEAVLMRLLQDNLPVFEYHNRWKSLVPDDPGWNVKRTYSDELKGFKINKNVKAADTSQYMVASSEVAKLPTLNRFYLEQMVKYCRSIGATPVLVSTPSTVNWNMARHNGMVEVAKELNITYIDLNMAPNKIDIDWNTETHDGGDHLNLSGATKVSAYIGTYLSSNYKLTNHQTDLDYSNWNELFVRYQQQVLT